MSDGTEYVLKLLEHTIYEWKIQQSQQNIKNIFYDKIEYFFLGFNLSGFLEKMNPNNLKFVRKISKVWSLTIPLKNQWRSWDYYKALAKKNCNTFFSLQILRCRPLSLFGFGINCIAANNQL